MEDLEELAEKIRECTRCELSDERTNAAPGEGPADADVMFVGEGPGRKEDETGRPFVGSAGQTLNDLLGEAGLERSEVFIVNVLKCRPPDNRDPTEEEIEACSPYLEKQMRIIKPKLVVSLGRFAAKLLLGRNVKVSKEHGEVKDFEFGGWSSKLFVSYHPAAALYGGGTRVKLEEDFEKLGEIVDNLNDFKTTQQMTLG